MGWDGQRRAAGGVAAVADVVWLRLGLGAAGLLGLYDPFSSLSKLQKFRRPEIRIQNFNGERTSGRSEIQY